MKCIGFDIGIYNLAYCIVEAPTEGGKECVGSQAQITDWGIICLKDPDVKTMDFTKHSKKLIEILHEKFMDMSDIDVVVIENQPCMKNPVMKSIQMLIYTFFMIKAYQQGSSNMQVKLVSASNKLKVHHKCDVSQIDTKDKYKKNKLMAIAYTQHYLQLSEAHNKAWCDKFNVQKKKDDLSDAYLSVIHHIEQSR